MLSFLVAGISALLSALCYSEFAVCFPISGGAFNYVLATLGEYAAWLTVATLVSARVRGTRGRRARVCLRARACSDRCRRDKKKTLNSKTPPTKHPKNIKILEYVLANAAVARTWAPYLGQLVNKGSSFFVISSGGYEVDPMAAGLVFICCMMLIKSTGESALVNAVITVAHIVVVLFIIIAGFTKANPANLTPFMPFGVKGIFQGAAFVFFSYIVRFGGCGGCFAPPPARSLLSLLPAARAQKREAART